MFTIQKFVVATDGQTVMLSASMRVFSVAADRCATITHRVPGVPVLAPTFIPVR